MPGNVFERRYNATSIVDLEAGKLLEASDFNAETIKKIVDDFNRNSAYTNNAKKIG